MLQLNPAGDRTIAPVEYWMGTICQNPPMNCAITSFWQHCGAALEPESELWLCRYVIKNNQSDSLGGRRQEELFLGFDIYR